MEKVNILGTKVSVVSDRNVMSEVRELLTKKRQIQITTPNAEHILLALENEEFRKVINESDLAIPDGMSVVRAISRKLKVKSEKLKVENKEIIGRVTGVDLMMRLCELANENNWKVGLLGGEDWVREQAARILAAKFKKCEFKAISSHKNIKESKKEDDKILQEIKEEKIDVLFVAYGAPYQEIWIRENLNKMRVRVAMGVGGAFDLAAGRIKRAPISWQKNGLEWLWRLIQEPWRIKRQIKLVKFWWKSNHEYTNFKKYTNK